MTGTEIIKSILGLFKLTPRHFGIFALTALTILLLPAQFLKSIGVATLNDNYRLILFVVFILSMSGLLIDFIRYISRKIVRYRFTQKGKARLNILTKEERNILRLYFTNESRTQYFEIFDGAVGEFVSLGILIRYAPISDYDQRFPFGISEWAYQYLLNKRHLLNP